MKNLSRFLFSIGGTLLCVGMAHAQTLVITDNLAPHSPRTRFEQFSTTLSANVQNPPTSNEEIEITGPSYLWSGGGSGTSLNATTGNSPNLESASPPNYAGATGEQSVTVNCIATYTRKNKNTGAALSPITVPSSKVVKFFIRVPKKVKEIRRYPGTLGEIVGSSDSRVSPFKGPDYWGQLTNFDLQIQDNQSSPQPYGAGEAREDFASVTGEGGTQPNGTGGGGIWPVGGPPGSGNPGGNSVVGGNFTDHNGVYTQIDRRLAPYNWSANTVIFDFTQNWFCREAMPPYPSGFDQETAIGSHHVTVHYLDPTERTGG